MECGATWLSVSPLLTQGKEWPAAPLWSAKLFIYLFLKLFKNNFWLCVRGLWEPSSSTGD